MAVYRVWPGPTYPGGINPPAVSTNFGVNAVVGLAFKVTSPAVWLNAFQWWRADATQIGTAVPFTLWQVTPIGHIVITTATVTSGALTVGAWNRVALPAPIQLTPNAIYVAAVGLSNGNGPFTTNYWGTGGPGIAGLTNGPLTAFSDAAAQGGTNPEPSPGGPQAPFQAGNGSDPTVVFPATGFQSSNLWLDVEVTDTPPPGASYRLWPSYGLAENISVDTTGYTMSMEFSLTQACNLTRIWWFSASGAVVLPSRCAIWSVAGQTVVTGTDHTVPNWRKPDGTAAAAGNGWMYSDYTGAGVALALSTNYKVAVFAGPGSQWRTATNPYWAAGGPAPNGLTNGPLIVPNSAGATPGQDSWNNTGVWTYPNTFSNPENDWVDVEVTPIPLVTGSGLLLTVFP